jgi:class 3 adenylate cyclase
VRALAWIFPLIRLGSIREVACPFADAGTATIVALACPYGGVVSRAMPRLTQAPVRYARAAGVNIAYQVLGDGPIDIVYVPGLLNLIEATAEEPAIERHFERMTSFSQLVIFDKRGTGLSDRVPAEEMADPARRMEDLIAVMDAVGVQRATLFATADGALVALRFAARCPERVQALVILEGTAKWVAGEGYDAGVPVDLIPPAEIWDELWGSETDPLVVEMVAPSVAADPRWRRVLGRMQRRAGTPAAARLYWETTMLGEDVRDVLSEIAAPTLVMHSAGDTVVPVAQGRFLAAGIEGARFVELPGADHFHWFTNGDAVADETQAFLTGSRSAVAGGRRLATVLFTDIVGSTEQARRLGDARWRDLLEDHDRLVRRHLARYGGQDIKFTGDGFLAHFEDPLPALACAQELCLAVKDIGLEIRAGMHTGHVELRGEDVVGMAVNVAARVLAQAGPSEVLVTRTIKDLLAGSGPTFVSRGVHQLKGVPDTWELYALEA